jgi:hypothetical protein
LKTPATKEKSLDWSRDVCKKQTTNIDKESERGTLPHRYLLHACEELWQAMGWETKILTEKDAIKHLHMLKLLNETFKNNRAVPYNHRCYWRWLAEKLVSRHG